ncbi:Spy/CpxP family protein refolding chaperone [Bradyrhizobium ivorense]|uniref:Spy/CpxP family protein refolding chaperone n=1 Tax=Bradyrhizobium ivorense TaxID=2511166 RepID=UPI00111606CC|nr:Spy/CpxP family protein refolding chaperone [Bradyrhizobium ivorense]
MAAAGVALVVLGALPSAAEAGFRLRVGGPVSVARFAMAGMLSVAGLRHARMAARHSRVRMAALRPQDLRPAAESIRPSERAQLTAVVALAGWQGGRAAQGWWQHSDGSYGWVGPLFWPFAYSDLYDYALLNDGSSLWAYGYGDLYAAIFSPYAASDLSAFAAERPAARRHRKAPSVQELCSGDTAETTSLPLERIGRVVAANEAQRTAFDELASAWISAGDIIRASCPAQAATTALERFAAMLSRVDAMLSAVAAVQLPFQKFYDLLSDEQKARFNAPERDRRTNAAAAKLREMQDTACKASREPQDEQQAEKQYRQLVAQQWPLDDIAASLKLNDTQRAALEVVQDTTMGTMEALSACPPKDALTPPARLRAAKARLEAMREAIMSVNDAVDDFHWNLSDEQKTQFEGLGPKKRGA